MDSLFHFEGSSILLLSLTKVFYAEMWAQVKPRLVVRLSVPTGWGHYLDRIKQEGQNLSYESS